MKYIYRGRIIFQYDPEKPYDKVTLGYQDHGTVRIPEFDMCILGIEDYKLFVDFFKTVYLHMEGEPVELEDIVVN